MMNDPVMTQRYNLCRFSRSALRMGVALCASFALIPMAGCGGDEIRTYEVPKIAKVPDAVKAAGTGTPNTTNTNASTTGARLLAVIAPRGQEVWHFKMMGPSALVSPQAEPFIKFAQSVKFAPAKAGEETGSQPSWTLPAGWTQRPGGGMRFATIIVGESAHGMELTVFRFGPESADITSNVRRWAGQVGVNDVSDATLADMTRPLIIDDQSATLVDVTGPGGSGDPSMAGPARPQPPGPPQPPAKPEKLVATPPEGFAVDPNPGQFLISKYDFTKDGKTASLTVSSAGGDIEENLNRWRGQVGLAPWDETSIRKAFEEGKELKQAQLDGRNAIVIDLSGPGASGDSPERILGALTANPSGSIWFIKFRGPADLVDSQKDVFALFLKSIRFEN